MTEDQIHAIEDLIGDYLDRKRLDFGVNDSYMEGLIDAFPEIANRAKKTLRQSLLENSLVS